jgi:T5SS/PEP-CTERM-associated repeat protein
MTRTLVWTGADGTNFADANNWNDATDSLNPASSPPGSGDIAIIATSGTVGGTGDVSGLRFAAAPTLTGTVTAGDSAQINGALTVASGGVLNIGGMQGLGVGGDGSSPGSLTVARSGLVQVAGYLLVGGGFSGAAGVVTVQTGGTVADTASTSDGGVYVGGFDGTAAGTLIVQGTGALLNAGTSWLTIGYESTGTLAIVAGGIANAGTDTTIGYSGGTATVIVDGAGSTLDANTWLGVGVDGLGNLTISNGGLVEVDVSGRHYANERYSEIGQGTGSDGSSITVTGTGSELTYNGGVGVGWTAQGELDVQNGGLVNFTAPSASQFDSLLVGCSAAATGMVRVAGGTIDAGNNNIVVGVQASGTLDIGGGGRVDAGSGLLVGLGSDSNGSLDVDGAGSTLSVDKYLIIGGGLSAGGSGIVSATDGGDISSSADAALFSGGTLSVDGTGTVELGANGDAVAGSIVVDAGFSLSGAGTVSGPLVVHGTMEATGGVLAATGSVSGNGTLRIAAGATLKLDAADRGTVVVFDAPGGRLELAQADLGGALVNGFSPGSEIAVADAVDASGSVSNAGGVTTLALFNGSSPIGSLAFAGTPDVRFDSGSGVVTACFAAGTRIATARGEIAVEDLTVGDQLLRARRSGRTRPVVWLGHRSVDCRRHPRPWDVWPVRVAAGAFGPGRPRRDLMLSPDHAVFAGGVLIPVRHLVNGSTIAQTPVNRITYWHVELPRHDVILAEGLPAESFLDTGNRAAFANGGDATEPHPDFARRVWQSAGCAELVLGGAKLAGAKRRLLARAAMLGHNVTRRPAITLEADGHRLSTTVRGSHYTLRLPDGIATVTLRSRAWIPAHTDPDSDDTRTLGVAIANLVLDERKVSLASPALSAGWHAPEPDWRWTAGAAAIPLAGARRLAFDVAMTGRYWRAGVAGYFGEIRIATALRRTAGAVRGGS